MEANIKYFDKKSTKIKKIEKGDWIDLRCVNAKNVVINNTVTQTEKGLFLERKSTSTPITWQDGYIINEDGIEENIKFFTYSKGDFLLLDLGIGIQLPEGYEADVVPRSSTFKNFTLLQTNSFGVIDESYRGDNDKWFMPVLAMQDGFVIYDERLCQFRINKKMEDLKLNEKDKFNAEDRGGHGETGTK